MNKRNILLIMMGILLGGAMLAGSTFAFFTATVKNNTSMTADTYEKFSSNLNVVAIKNGQLVPVKDNLISSTLNSSNSCVGGNDYYLCNIYQITLTNSGNDETFTGDILTSSGTTYVTNNMKYQLYEYSSNTYTSVSDAKNLLYATNSVNNFTLNNSNISFTLSNGQSKVYYLVVWLSDTSSNQSDDISRKFIGTIEFYLSSGDKLTSQFTS